MSTIDTSTWNPDADLNVEIEGIPLNADASIQQTWRAIQMLMAALKGDTSAIKLTINQPDGTTIVATNQTLTVVDNGHSHTIANVAGLQTALDGKASTAGMTGATASADGASGLVPAPGAGDQDKVLKGDGTWGAVSAASSVAWSDVTGKPSTFTPSDHTHGNITNAGAIGSTSGLPVVTGADGVLQAGSFGTTAGTVCEGNDSRLSDARTPTSHTHGSITNDGKLGTASRAVVTDADGIIDVSSVTATELGCLSGVTSAVQTQLDGKAADSAVLHLAGDETISGSKVFNGLKITGSGNLVRTSDSGSVLLCAGTGNSVTHGSYLNMNGSGMASRAGEFYLWAGKNATTYAGLNGTPDGNLSWGGQPVQVTSDARLKTSMTPVPDAVLDAWEDVRWGAFQFLDAVKRKGEGARFHLGLIAQKVKTAFELHGLDACTYGILCHEERPATEGAPAVDLWMVRYEEALAMEAAYQRRRADRLEARIAVLEEKLNGR